MRGTLDHLTRRSSAVSARQCVRAASVATLLADRSSLSRSPAGRSPPRSRRTSRCGAPTPSSTSAPTEGAQLVQGAWRYHDADVVAVSHRAVGADLKPSGAPNRTFDLTPKAGVAEFDDSRLAGDSRHLARGASHQRAPRRSAGIGSPSRSRRRSAPSPRRGRRSYSRSSSTTTPRSGSTAG